MIPSNLSGIVGYARALSPPYLAHGDNPHINIETFEPSNLFPSDKEFIQIENENFYPKKD